MQSIFSFCKSCISASLLFFVIMALLLGGAAFADALKPVSGGATVPEAIEFSVRPGMGGKEIAQELEDNHIIKSKTAFWTYSILTSNAGAFQPGIYTVGPEQSVRDIISLMTKGPLEVEVLVTPGMTILEAEDVLVASKVLAEGDIVEFPIDTIREQYPFLGDAEILEGFLFPDTYRFYPHSDPKLVVSKFLDNFEAKLAPLLTDLRNPENNDTIHWLIIASILEKEVTNKKEDQTVAGILEKRLAIGMPLQVDASIIYAKCKRFMSCPALTRADFRIDSPYNSYLHKGLPPTPISNPGIDAISAARLPVRSNYLYYLSDPQTGQTIFSKTFEEHNANRTKYLH
ncbi:MAG: hypothetical protein ACD_81C00217G0006 [uncultured bacterium]|uniref:Endolytic murein transglycosylase n=2 Tax=Candidatus Wolfeibacteriota TaxID=1752735 RepID=A0A0G1HB38_9BACT|nr:MAG: hypothetical protein ACD_81C00217G0006 [uncultured bacterium]KKR12802.1 MAG: hypothetical protein UT41_C0001G0346 [Candidatus Wolfebacteria bacterium GW2011_GWC2_39_22]KKT43733.1 MAG: hypothetical protein UW32_C0001G0325 [Candidatus Wolfebacteria bacterium GW2011_GWE2_44_13]HBI25536.1 endolytic transglycosylase MltG [Candidatus Wolfebacteria bacterium]